MNKLDIITFIVQLNTFQIKPVDIITLFNTYSKYKNKHTKKEYLIDAIYYFAPRSLILDDIEINKTLDKVAATVWSKASPNLKPGFIYTKELYISYSEIFYNIQQYFSSTVILPNKNEKYLIQLKSLIDELINEPYLIPINFNTNNNNDTLNDPNMITTDNNNNPNINKFDIIAFITFLSSLNYVFTAEGIVTLYNKYFDQTDDNDKFIVDLVNKYSDDHIPMSNTDILKIYNDNYQSIRQYYSNQHIFANPIILKYNMLFHNIYDYLQSNKINQTYPIKLLKQLLEEFINGDYSKPFFISPYFNDNTSNITTDNNNVDTLNDTNMNTTNTNTDNNDNINYEMVNHPKHYNNYNKEVIDMMIDIWGPSNTYFFCIMNAFKYRMRMGTKPNNPIQQDIDKEKWYLDKANQIKSKYNIYISDTTI